MEGGMQVKDALLTAKEVADHLRLNVRTVLKLIERGELRAVKVAGRWRISIEALQEYLKRQDAAEK